MLSCWYQAIRIWRVPFVVSFELGHPSPMWPTFVSDHLTQNSNVLWNLRHKLIQIILQGTMFDHIVYCIIPHYSIILYVGIEWFPIVVNSLNNCLSFWSLSTSEIWVISAEVYLSSNLKSLHWTWDWMIKPSCAFRRFRKNI